MFVELMYVEWKILLDGGDMEVGILAGVEVVIVAEGCP